MASSFQTDRESGLDSCLVPLNESGDKPALFLLAGIGGHVRTFDRFARLLGADQPTYGVNAIGADGTRQQPDRMEEIAAHYVKAITAVRPRDPYLLGGYSIGAIIAFETAVQLRAAGRRVGMVAVFDMNAPGYPKQLPVARRTLIHFRNFLQLSGAEKKKDYVRERLANVTRRVYRRLDVSRRIASEVEGVSGRQQDALERVWIALQTAQRRYLPTRRFDGRVALFRAEQQCNWPATVFDDPLMGWGRWSTGGIEHHSIPGGHLDMFKDQNIGLLAEKLKGSIERALRAVRQLIVWLALPGLAQVAPVEEAALAGSVVAAARVGAAETSSE